MSKLAPVFVPPANQKRVSTFERKKMDKTTFKETLHNLLKELTEKTPYCPFCKAKTNLFFEDKIVLGGLRLIVIVKCDSGFHTNRAIALISKNESAENLITGIHTVTNIVFSEWENNLKFALASLN